MHYKARYRPLEVLREGIWTDLQAEPKPTVLVSA
jgi:arginyl-tRNA--protein-N-Asp/Glu arginylyltransferase